MKKLPLTQKDFDWHKLTPKQIEKIGKEAVEYKKAAYKKIKEILPENRTYENTVYALMESLGDYGDKLGFINLLTEVSTNKDVRDAGRIMLVELSQKSVDIEYDRDLYIAVLEYHEGNFLDEKKSLRKEDIKLLDEVLRDYKKMGFDLPEKEQKTLKVLLKKMAKLGNDFDKNINEYEDFILCTKEELEGLSETLIASFPSDKKTGKYKVTLQYPHYIPFMAFAKNRAKREELANKELQKGGKKNVKILNHLVDLRSKVAKILQYQHHADLRTDDRMAKNAETVVKMQDGLIKKVSVLAKKDMETLQSHAETLGIPKLGFYDISYVANDLKVKLYDVNPEVVREYFPLENVREQMFALYSTLFGIKIKEEPMKLWHKDAKLYKVTNKDNSLVGYFVLDLFPREGKYGHACAVNLIRNKERTFKGKEMVTPLSVILCNFATPTKKGKKTIPCLLAIREVETLFHEFGHCIHGVLSLAVHGEQSGTSVARDFVETPSQIMENWVWNDVMLKKLSKHYETGKSLPKELREKLLAGRKFQSGYAYMRQLIFTKLDMDMHMGKISNAQQAYRDLMKTYLYVTLPEKETLFPAGFGHMNGYDAGYYSYLWALVYAQDAFSLFQEHGLFNKELGMKWRKEVLEKGSSEDELQLIKNFLGRKPSDKAFLKELGVK